MKRKSSLWLEEVHKHGSDMLIAGIGTGLILTSWIWFLTSYVLVTYVQIAFGVALSFVFIDKAFNRKYVKAHLKEITNMFKKYKI